MLVRVDCRGDRTDLVVGVDFQIMYQGTEVVGLLSDLYADTRLLQIEKLPDDLTQLAPLVMPSDDMSARRYAVRRCAVRAYGRTYSPDQDVEIRMPSPSLGTAVDANLVRLRQRRKGKQRASASVR